MKITKLGHCCLLIETHGLTILTDPGTYSTRQNNVKGIDAVLITHEHADHLHVDSLKQVLANNPKAKVISNVAVGNILTKEGIAYELVVDKQSTKVGEVLIEGFGTKHAEIYKTIVPVENTGYMVDKKLYYPGDAFYNPGRPVDVLALPVAGPWMKISEAIDFAIALKPRVCFPVHDGILHPDRNLSARMGKMILDSLGIKFVPMAEGSVEEF